MGNIRITNVELQFKSVLIESSNNNIEIGINHHFIFTFNNGAIIELTQETYNYIVSNKWDNNATYVHKDIIRIFYNADGVIDWIAEQKHKFVLKRLNDLKSNQYRMEKDPIWKDYILKENYDGNE